MKARACAVASCLSLTTGRRVFCVVHAGVAAFDDDGDFLCPRCARARARGGRGLAVADGEWIAEVNRSARTADERASCADCDRFLPSPSPSPSPRRPRKERRGRLPVPVRLHFTPLPARRR